MLDQETDLRVLEALLPAVAPTFIDVGAEKGRISEWFIEHGFKGHALEPFSRHAAALRQLAATGQLTFLPYAVDAQDGSRALHIATDDSGKPLDYFHSLQPLQDDQRVHHTQSEMVVCRSLGSLVAEGQLPPKVGVLKIDTEGNDFRVLQGLLPLQADLVLAEYFTEGIYAGWNEADPLKIMHLAAGYGYTHTVAVRRRGDGLERITLQPLAFQKGEWGNLLLMRGHVFDLRQVALAELVNEAEEKTIAKLAEFDASCRQRLELINSLQAEAEKRMALVKELTGQCEGYQDELAAKDGEIHELKRICDVRDEIIHKLSFSDKHKFAHGRILAHYAAQGTWTKFRRFCHQRTKAWLEKHVDCRVGVLDQYPPKPLAPETFPRLKAPPAWPRICLITPSFQQAAFLERTMQSVLDQNYPNLAYGVQDGGSPDGSAALIVKNIARLAHAESAPDQGQADAIHKGFGKLFPGENDIMGWLNSDDMLMPGALAYVGAYFARHPGVDVIYGHRVVIDENDLETGRWFLPRYHKHTLPWFDLVPQETLFWRAGCYRMIGGVDTSFQFAVDWDLLLRFEAAGCTIRRVPYFLGCFRQHPLQKTSSRIHDVGEGEMQKLRLRTHGRQVQHWEILEHLSTEERRSALTAWLWARGIRW